MPHFKVERGKQESPHLSNIIHFMRSWMLSDWVDLMFAVSYVAIDETIDHLSVQLINGWS